MLYTDLRELKAVLEIDPGNTAEDKKLNFCNEWASALIEQYCKRDFSFKYRTQYYPGTGTQKLLLKNRPVFPSVGTANALSVWVDEAALGGTASSAFTNTDALLSYGTDYFLKGVDPESNSSKQAILYRVTGYWPRPAIRQRGYLTPFIQDDTESIKVSYLAGYTVENLPPTFRMACNLLVARLRYILPIGFEMGGEGYEERSIAIIQERREYLMSMIKPLLFDYRNWRF